MIDNKKKIMFENKINRKQLMCNTIKKFFFYFGPLLCGNNFG